MLEQISQQRCFYGKQRMGKLKDGRNAEVGGRESGVLGRVGAEGVEVDSELRLVISRFYQQQIIIIFHQFIRQMAQLRTSFIQTCNPTCPFFTCFTSVVSYSGSLFNNDDQEDNQNLKSQTNPPPLKTRHSFTYFRQNQLFLSQEKRFVHSLINLNINNLSQLMDNQSNDFKGHDNFVHVLELDQEENEVKTFQQMETLQSLHLEDHILLVNNESPNSTRIGSEETAGEEDYSDVQPFEV